MPPLHRSVGPQGSFPAGPAAGVLLGALLAPLLGCGGATPEPSPWHSLARDLRSPLPAAAAGLEPSAEDGGLWIETQIEAAAWTPVDFTGAEGPPGGAHLWWAPAPGAPVGTPAGGGPALELLLGAAESAPQADPGLAPELTPGLAPELAPGLTPELAVVGGVAQLEEGQFTSLDGRVILHSGSPEPPRGARLRTFVDLGDVDEDGHARLTLSSFTGDGITLWDGEEVSVDLPAGPARTLHFVTAVLSRGDAGGAARFEVLLGDELLLGHRQEAALPESRERHALALEASDAPRRLTLRATAEACLPAILTPVLAPAPAPTSVERAASGAAPDLIVFLADTLRADMLTAYGGTLGTMPGVDAWARRSTVFTEARSPATWTLPAHASLMTGLQPPQHGAVHWESQLAADARSIAEILRAAGYRTGAVTDAVYVSQAFGMDQGFETFLEHPDWDLDTTVAEALAFLDADDGRPTFLFVQSYRAHAPFEVSPETWAAWGERLGLGRTWGELQRDALDDGFGQPGVERGYTEELKALYAATTVELDAGFSAFLAGLERRGFPDHGTLVFTSDHGEGFHEHGITFHGGVVWDELIRIPLVVRGPRFSPGPTPVGASLVDLAPTLAHLADVPADPGWAGRSLVDLRGERPILSFSSVEDPWVLSIVERDRKVFAEADAAVLASGEYISWFDLAADPGERERRPAGEAAIEKLCRRLGPTLEAQLTLQLQLDEADLDSDRRRRLEAAGYAGD